MEATVRKARRGIRRRPVWRLRTQRAFGSAGTRGYVGAGDVVASVVYEPEPTAPASARRFVRDTLQAWVTTGTAADGHGLIDDAVLLTSELVTNAVVHAGTRVRITCRLVEDGIEVIVSDGHPAGTVPEPPLGGHVPADRTSGRGLLLPSALASAWGITYGHSAKAVWFRLRLAGAATGPGLAGGGAGPDGALAGLDTFAAAVGRDGALPRPATPGEPGYGALLTTALTAARAAVGADAAYALMVSEDGDLGLQAAVGPAPPRAQAGQASPAEDGPAARPGPASPAEPLLPGEESPGEESPGEETPAAVTVAFVVDGRVTGLLAAVGEAGRQFGDDEAMRLRRLADRWGPVLERARLCDLARIRRGRIGALAEARGLLRGGLSPDEVTALAAGAAVPGLVPWCAVLLREGDELRTALARHVDGELSGALAWLLDQACEAMTAEVPPPRCPASHSPDSHSRVRRWPLAVPLPAEAPAGAAALAAETAWCFPLGPGAQQGVMAVGGGRDGRLPREVAEIVADIACRAGIALAAPALVRQRN